jgi:hypothetical protein
MTVEPPTLSIASKSLSGLTTSIPFLEGIIERLGEHGEMRTPTPCCPLSRTPDQSRQAPQIAMSPPPQAGTPRHNSMTHAAGGGPPDGGRSPTLTRFSITGPREPKDP